MNDVKLIATDMDGTFFEEGCGSITDEDVSIINALIDKGYIFCACSGRPYCNIRSTFAPVADRMLFICDNGANIIYNGKCLYRDVIDRALCNEFIGDILSLDDGCEMVVCTPDNYVVIPKRQELIKLLTVKWHMNVKSVPDVKSIDEDILKLTVYYYNGIDMVGAKKLQDKWLEKLNNSFISGTTWLDFQNADKGRGLREAAKQLGIDMAEVMAFGDNYNDVTMLDSAGESYAMSHSPEDVKSHAKYVTPSVQKVLKGLI